MSFVIQNRFNDLEDITKEETFNFFFVSNEEKSCLDRDYNTLKEENQYAFFLLAIIYYLKPFLLLLELFHLPLYQV